MSCAAGMQARRDYLLLDAGSGGTGSYLDHSLITQAWNDSETVVPGRWNAAGQCTGGYGLFRSLWH